MVQAMHHPLIQLKHGTGTVSSSDTSMGYIHFRPVIMRWSGSTSRMRVIGEARNANLLSRTRLIAVSVVYWWVGNLYDVCIGLTELGGLSQSPCKME